MRIYDCFSYWDEDILLDLRLNILDEHVDYFVIVEGNRTWQNNYKKLRFDINKFLKFKKKIIYIPVEDMPGGDNPYKRENFQRNCISRGLINSSDNDLIIISDLDEIPKLTQTYDWIKILEFINYYGDHIVNVFTSSNDYIAACLEDVIGKTDIFVGVDYVDQFYQFIFSGLIMTSEIPVLSLMYKVFSQDIPPFVDLNKPLESFLVKGKPMLPA